MTPKELATYQKLLDLLNCMATEIGVVNFKRGDLEAAIYEQFRVGLSAEGHDLVKSTGLSLHDSGARHLIQMVINWHIGLFNGSLEDNIIIYFNVEPRLKVDMTRHPLLQTEPHGQEPHRGEAESDRP